MKMIKRMHVPAGTFYISKKHPVVLQAFLGTCVGVCLYCRNSGVGGIIHLLLPEPISRSYLNQPEKYAATGLPLFIQKLLEAGAQSHCLVASIAGGALVGPVSSQDLVLDIGGRTVDVARAVLERAGIQVDRSETGGFFTCCLNLNMNTGNCLIEPVGYRESENLDFKVPDTADIKLTLDRLKPIPQVALKVLRLIENDDEVGIEKVAQEVRKDQVITARTLQLANSALLGSRKAIESLDHALVYLGLSIFIKMVISAAVQTFFAQSALGYSLCKGGLYHHAVGCAQTTEMLACRTKLVSPEKAYTAGLLHDIGKVVLDQYVTASYPFFYRAMMETGEEVLTMEKRFLGTDHTQVGGILAEQWGFSDGLSQAIVRHHHPDLKEEAVLPRLVYMADVLMSRFHIGYEMERMDTCDLPAQLKSLNLDTSDFYRMVDMIPSTVFTATATEQPASALC